MSTIDLRQAIGLHQFATLLISAGMILIGYLGYTYTLTPQAALFAILFIVASILSFYTGRLSQPK